MSGSRETVVAIVPQRRRNRPFVALVVAPKCARPRALRDLYTDAGSLIRHATPPVTTSRTS